MDDPTKPGTLSVSVVIPAFNAARELRACLEALALSSHPPDEILVVDDGSDDHTVRVAQQFRVVLLSTGGRKGPAAARNIGARHARGTILVFLDSDVGVHPDALSRIEQAFAADPSLSALMGSYDDHPACADLLSNYRNLMHRYVHLEGCREATTFWSGCGAIRREVFEALGGFSTSYARPAIEDIELGYRLHAAGKHIRLDPDVQVKHLKRWTFGSLIRTDIFDRGIPWTVLIFRSGRMPNDLNLRWHQRASMLLVFLALVTACIGAFFGRLQFLVPLTALLFLILGSYWVQAATSADGKQAGGWLVAALSVFTALGVSYGQSWLIWLVAGGYALLALRRLVRHSALAFEILGSAYGAYVLTAIAVVMFRLPPKPEFLVLCGLIAGLVALNIGFYVFLFHHLGKLSAVTAVPLHCVYFLCGGIGFVIGAVQYWHGRWSGGRESTGMLS